VRKATSQQSVLHRAPTDHPAGLTQRADPVCSAGGVPESSVQSFTKWATSREQTRDVRGDTCAAPAIMCGTKSRWPGASSIVTDSAGVENLAIATSTVTPRARSCTCASHAVPLVLELLALCHSPPVEPKRRSSVSCRRTSGCWSSAHAHANELLPSALASRAFLCASF
jgi:hypothetical protein